MTFYRCEHCGNIIVKLTDGHVPVVCCGEVMRALETGDEGGSLEKHVPDVESRGQEVAVRIGHTEHPMLDEHWIEWIVLETNEGFITRRLAPNMAPKAAFCLAAGEKPRTVYAYCNIHGLWKADV